MLFGDARWAACVGVIHCDIKPCNIVVSSVPDGLLQCDLGLIDLGCGMLNTGNKYELAGLEGQKGLLRLAPRGNLPRGTPGWQPCELVDGFVSPAVLQEHPEYVSDVRAMRSARLFEYVSSATDLWSVFFLVLCALRGSDGNDQQGPDGLYVLSRCLLLHVDASLTTRQTLCAWPSAFTDGGKSCEQCHTLWRHANSVHCRKFPAFLNSDIEGLHRLRELLRLGLNPNPLKRPLVHQAREEAEKIKFLLTDHCYGPLTAGQGCLLQGWDAEMEQVAEEATQLHLQPYQYITWRQVSGVRPRDIFSGLGELYMADDVPAMARRDIEAAGMLWEAPQAAHLHVDSASEQSTPAWSTALLTPSAPASSRHLPTAETGQQRDVGALRVQPGSLAMPQKLGPQGQHHKRVRGVRMLIS